MQKICFLVVVIISTLALSPVQAEERDTLHVAAILPLTGEAASWGQAFKNGMTLATASLDPEIRQRIKITYEDDGMSARNAVSALSKIYSTGPVDVVLNLSSGTAIALAPITEAKRTVLLALASDPAIGNGRQFAYNFWVTPETEVQTLIPEMKRRQYKEVAWVGVIQSGALAVKDIFTRSIGNDIKILVEQDFAPDVKDFKSFISKLKAKENDIDGIMAVFLPGQLSLFARQLREAGVRTPLFGWETMEDANEVKLANGALLGAWYVNADDGNSSFLTAYQTRFPGDSTFPAGSGHDAVMILASALKAGVKPENINQYISSLKDFSGALGSYSSTGDQRFSLPATIKVVTENGFEKVTP